MTPRITIATTIRVIAQLRRDPRTIALLVVVPCLLMVLLRAVIGDGPSFQNIAVPLAGIFPLISMFLVASIALLRERTSGTLERLMTMPIGKLDLLFGYAAAFALIAIAQAVVVCVVMLGPLNVPTKGSVVFLITFSVANGLLGMAIGLFISAFARTEFQAVQFMPAFLLPQLMLCGIFGPRGNMAGALEALSDVLPMTYAYEALKLVATQSGWSADLTRDLVVIVAGIVVSLALGAVTLRRQTV